jgi:hypothetical protein
MITPKFAPYESNFAPYDAKQFFISAILQEKLKLEQSDVFYSLVPRWQIQQASPKNHSRVSGRSQAIQEVFQVVERTLLTKMIVDL